MIVCIVYVKGLFLILPATKNDEEHKSEAYPRIGACSWALIGGAAIGREPSGEGRGGGRVFGTCTWCVSMGDMMDIEVCGCRFLVVAQERVGVVM